MLTSQLSSEPDSNLNLSRPSLDSPSADTAIIEDDEDVLPASPVPVNQPRLFQRLLQKRFVNKLNVV